MHILLRLHHFGPGSIPLAKKASIETHRDFNTSYNLIYAK